MIAAAPRARPYPEVRCDLRLLSDRTSASASLLAIASLASAQAAPTLLEQSVVFDYGNADPYDRANLCGFNHAPSVTCLSDGRLMAAWFSGPYEGSVHQVILGTTSADGGKTWAKASIVCDVPRKSDFDPAFIADGPRT